jgi:hypothetical protein
MGPPTGGGGKKVAAAGGGPSKGGVGKKKAAAGTPKGTSNDGLAKQATLNSWLRQPGARPGRGVYQGRSDCFLTAVSLHASVTGKQGDGAAAGCEQRRVEQPSLGAPARSVASFRPLKRGRSEYQAQEPSLGGAASGAARSDVEESVQHGQREEHPFFARAAANVQGVPKSTDEVHAFRSPSSPRHCPSVRAASSSHHAASFSLPPSEQPFSRSRPSYCIFEQAFSRSRAAQQWRAQKPSLGGAASGAARSDVEESVQHGQREEHPFFARAAANVQGVPKSTDEVHAFRSPSSPRHCPSVRAASSSHHAASFSLPPSEQNSGGSGRTAAQEKLFSSSLSSIFPFPLLSLWLSFAPPKLD